MIKYFFNYFICKIKNHQWAQAGSCPFTGKNYNICTRCGNMVINEK